MNPSYDENVPQRSNVCMVEAGNDCSHVDISLGMVETSHRQILQNWYIKVLIIYQITPFCPFDEHSRVIHKSTWMWYMKRGHVMLLQMFGIFIILCLINSFMPHIGRMFLHHVSFPFHSFNVCVPHLYKYIYI